MVKLTARNFDRVTIKMIIKDWKCKERVKMALFCAELVLPYYSGVSDAPQKAISAVKKWLENPVIGSDSYSDTADAAVYAAQDASRDEVYVGEEAASASSSAAYSAACAAYSLQKSGWDIGAALKAATINDEIKHQIIKYINNKGEQHV